MAEIRRVIVVHGMVVVVIWGVESWLIPSYLFNFFASFFGFGPEEKKMKARFKNEWTQTYVITVTL